MSRMSQLIALAKQRKLTDEERSELQKLFIRLAWQDVRVLRAEYGGHVKATYLNLPNDQA